MESPGRVALSEAASSRRTTHGSSDTGSGSPIPGGRVVGRVQNRWVLPVGVQRYRDVAVCVSLVVVPPARWQEKLCH